MDDKVLVDAMVSVIKASQEALIKRIDADLAAMAVLQGCGGEGSLEHTLAYASPGKPGGRSRKVFQSVNPNLSLAEALARARSAS